MLANDRLKFRAWSRNSQRMLPWLEVKDLFEEWDDAMTDLILMQFTGMADSGDTPIYEGDIIADKEDDDSNWVVVWSPIALAFMLGDLQHDPRDENYFKFENPTIHLENNISPYDAVVGNVFENEELLNVNLE